MDTSLIISKMESVVAERGCFITEVSVTPDNEIELAVESENGTVEMDDCVAISDKFHEIFDQDTEDYGLTVTSAGLDRPFKVLKQYIKAIGSKVEVKTRDGRKIICDLVSADEEKFTVGYEVKELIPGKKKKELVRHEETFAYSDVNSVMPHIEFEK